jgi:hypothetical protein
LAAGALALLCACDAAGNQFAVFDPDVAVLRAELRLCEKTVPMEREGQGLTARMDIDCEGSGAIVLTLRDGRSATCPIGYVTPGAMQNFNFIVEGDRCNAVLPGGMRDK